MLLEAPNRAPEIVPSVEDPPIQADEPRLGCPWNEIISKKTKEVLIGVMEEAQRTMGTVVLSPVICPDGRGFSF
jgi:hypothetical protein